MILFVTVDTVQNSLHWFFKGKIE